MGKIFTTAEIADIAEGMRRGNQIMAEMIRRQTPDEPGDFSGDREPRGPSPVSPLIGGAALELVYAENQ